MSNDLSKSIKEELNSQALSDLAERIVGVVKDFESHKIDSEQAKIKIAAFKHLVQIIAIDWMTMNYRKQPRRISSAKNLIAQVKHLK